MYSPRWGWLSWTKRLVNGRESRKPNSTWTPRPATRSSWSSSIRFRSSLSASVSAGRAGSGRPAPRGPAALTGAGASPAMRPPSDLGHSLRCQYPAGGLSPGETYPCPTPTLLEQLALTFGGTTPYPLDGAGIDGVVKTCLPDLAPGADRLGA